MLKQYSKKKLEHTLEMLHMYQLAIANGRFQRANISSAMGKEPNVVEGRWYGEMKRTKKFGVSYDWKTILNAKVVQQIEQHNRDPAIVRTIIGWFQRGDVQTKDLLDLLDGKVVPGSNAKNIVSPTQSGEAQGEEEWAAFFFDDTL